MDTKPVVHASVREVVEFTLLSGSLLPGTQLARMREGTLGHQARQRAMPDARAEVVVRGEAQGDMATLAVSGRIDLLYEQDGVPVVEEIKLTPVEPPAAAVPVHRAQAVCYAHMLDKPVVTVRVCYIHRDGEEAAAFAETITQEQLRAEFTALTAPYLAMAEDRLRWRATRDASLRTLPFPFASYRQGQRDMAVHAYWAVKSKKRLFAQAPTGTGKTAAALYPALKALGEGLTGQIFYLTARTTAQQNAATSLNRMREGGLRLRVLTITAKEKVCTRAASEETAPIAPSPGGFRCDLLTCPCAIGFFDRLPAALSDMRRLDDWSRENVLAAAHAHQLCPHEFSLSLCEEADAVLCDYNYAFDPAARIKRVFQWTTSVTLLVDEAHNLPDRARAMLSAELSSQMMREIRRTVGKILGRKNPLYLSLTALIAWLEAREDGAHAEKPDDLLPLLEACMDALLAAPHVPVGDLPRALLASMSALERFSELYTVLTARQGKRAHVQLFCLDPAPHLRDVTRKLRGCVFFSATLTPLSAFRDAIGGTEEDGLLSLPSPFPQENLLVLRSAVSTRYRAREQTADLVAAAILAVTSARPGNYLACFPSYAYLARVRDILQEKGDSLTLHVQRGGMDEAAREEYLAAFTPRDTGALLGMVVLGGVFGEGVDLPGDRLSGVIVVGVGLPQICPERELLRAYYDQALSDGFAHAYRYPGMNKVLQAVGRVIRTETDRGVALLIDDRFLSAEYTRLMPPWWGEAVLARDAGDIRARTEGFWQCGSSM